MRSAAPIRMNAWLLAVAAAIAGMLFRMALAPYVGSGLPLVGAFPAILLAAWYGGFWPGMLTTGICVIWSMLQPFPDGLGNELSVWLRLALMLPSGLLICLLAEQLHRKRREADRRLDGIHRLTRPSQRLQAALELAAISAFDVDRGLRYTWVQKPPVGLREADMIGKLAEEIYEPDVANALTAARKRILETGAPFRFELEVNRGGRTEWVDWIGGSLRDAHGAVIGVANLAIDITELKQSEVALRRSGDAQHLLVELQDATRDLTAATEIKAVIVQRVGRHFKASRCVFADIATDVATVDVRCDYTDQAPSVVGRHRLGPSDSAVLRRLLAGRTVATHDIGAGLPEEPSAALPDEAWMMPDSGSSQTGALLCVPVLQDGRLVAALSLRCQQPHRWNEDEIRLAEHVTQRSWAAIERARAVEDLRESRDVLTLAMRGGRMGAWSRELESGHVWWSSELKEIFGLESEGFSGTQEDFLDLLHPEDRDRVRNVMGQALLKHTDFIVEYRFRHASKQWRWMESRGRSVYRSDGSPRITYGLGIDITERKTSEDERRRLHAELAQSLQRKDEFLATLAHELRNPLAPIVTALEVLRLKGPADAQLRWSRDVIERQVRHMTRLVDDLLDVARIASGKAQLRTERIDLTTVINHAVESVRGAIDAGGHQLALTLPSHPLLLDADPTRLSQVLANLLSNAAKYTQRGGRIAVDAWADGSDVVVTVADNGLGLSDSDRERIFSMFAQVTPAIDRSQGGLGIGLAVSRGLVELHGGKIHASSEGLHKGCTLTVRLPRADTSQAHATQPADSEDAKPAALRRILVVDDNLDAAQSLAMLLELDGHETAMAHDGERALLLAREFDPHVILLDIGLPLMNGYEVARRVREQPWGHAIRLIAVTGWGQEQDRQQSLAAGFDHHLTKPLDPARLASLLAGANS